LDLIAGPYSGKCVVLKTSTRQTIFLPVVGLVDASELKPNDLVGVNKDSYLVLDKLPAEYDSRVKAMEVRLLRDRILPTNRALQDEARYLLVGG
jgi:ATP-dependent 26S proteasome regulatory subunit